MIFSLQFIMFILILCNM